MENLWPNGYKSCQYSTPSGENGIGPNHRSNDYVQNQAVSSLRSNTLSASWQPNPVETGWHPSSMGNGWQSSSIETGWQQRSLGNGWQPHTLASSWQHNAMTRSWPPCTMPSGSLQNAVACERTEYQMTSDWQPTTANTTCQPWKMAASQQPHTIGLGWQSSKMTPGSQANNLEAYGATNETTTMPTDFHVNNVTTVWGQTTTTEPSWQPNSMQTGLQANTAAISSQPRAMPIAVDPATATASVDSYPLKPADKANQPLALRQKQQDTTVNPQLRVKINRFEPNPNDLTFCNECSTRVELLKKDLPTHNIIRHLDMLLMSVKSPTLFAYEFKEYCDQVIQNHLVLFKMSDDCRSRSLYACQLCSHTCKGQWDMQVHLFTTHEQILRDEVTKLQATNTHLLTRKESQPVELKPSHEEFICEDCNPRCLILKCQKKQHNVERHAEKFFIKYKPAMMSKIEFIDYCENFIKHEITSCYLLETSGHDPLREAANSKVKCSYCVVAKIGYYMRRHLIAVHLKILQKKFAQFLTSSIGSNQFSVKPVEDGEGSWIVDLTGST